MENSVTVLNAIPSCSTTHHEFSPSSLNRLADCKASYKICKDWVHETSQDASHGTLMHSAVYDDNSLALLSSPDQEIINHLRTEHVYPYAELEHYHELKVSVVNKSGKVITEGTLDYLVIDKTGTLGNLKDWKFGNNFVPDAISNPQIKTYVAGAFQKFPKLTTIFAMIVQPAVAMDDYQKQAEFHRDELDSIVNEIETIITDAQNADLNSPASYNCNSVSCIYCNHFNCPAYQKWMQTNFSLMQVKPEGLDASTRNLTIDFADRLVSAEKAIKDAMKEKTDIAKKVIIQAGGSANYRVQQGRITKTVDWEAIRKQYLIPDAEINANTKETQGEPFVVAKTRKSPKKLIEAKVG